MDFELTRQATRARLDVRERRAWAGLYEEARRKLGIDYYPETIYVAVDHREHLHPDGDFCQYWVMEAALELPETRHELWIRLHPNGAHEFYRPNGWMKFWVQRYHELSKPLRNRDQAAYDLMVQYLDYATEVAYEYQKPLSLSAWLAERDKSDLFSSVMKLVMELKKDYRVMEVNDDSETYAWTAFDYSCVRPSLRR